MTNAAIDKRIEFNELNTKISYYIEWDSEEGRNSDLPKIKENFKDILFTDWDARVKQEELAIARAAGISNNMVKIINHILHTSGLIKEGNFKSFLDIKDLEQSWKKAGQLREETLLQLKKTDWEAYWQLLVKPHSQIMTLNCFLNSIQIIQLLLLDTIFSAQMKIESGKPPQFQPMSDIC